MDKKRVIAYDIGTTGVKTCVFELDKTVNLLGYSSAGYNLYVLPGGGAEQEPDEWWDAMCRTTKAALGHAGIEPEAVDGISFCSQMQGLVLADKDGRPVRRAMSYMDQRAREELKKGLAYGIKIAGANVFKLLKSLKYTGAVAASVKDPVWKYKWVEAHEPEVFKKAYKWLDVKESLVCRMTGEFAMTRDSAFAALLYDIHKERWSTEVCKMLGVNTAHLPEIRECTDKIGALLPDAAAELGLAPGTPVFGGGGDASLIGVGAGAVLPGDTHVYSGTSGWVSTVVEKSIVDAGAMIAAIVGADKGRYNYFAELETAGKCLEWVKDHLALDEIGVYLDKKNVTDEYEGKYTSLYEYMTEIVRNVPAGSGGVIFTPWLHGNRCPFEDPNARGMFFNISLDTGKSELIRAVLEGVCFHLNWFIEAQDKKVKTSDTLRFAGGGALSPVTCQILADVTGKTVETVASPQNAGAVGAAITAAVGLGVIEKISDAKKLVPADAVYKPNPANKAVYDRNYTVFKNLYKDNKKNFSDLNKE
ncbi:MAG: FGGY-family carbohydrate kinase [Oscillospiraceae bacterium]|nr:FGGY-family carbohydrate kinase [Oscillospiraceae bacterium]